MKALIILFNGNIAIPNFSGNRELSELELQRRIVECLNNNTDITNSSEATVSVSMLGDKEVNTILLNKSTKNLKDIFGNEEASILRKIEDYCVLVNSKIIPFAIKKDHQKVAFFNEFINGGFLNDKSENDSLLLNKIISINSGNSEHNKRCREILAAYNLCELPDWLKEIHNILKLF